MMHRRFVVVAAWSFAGIARLNAAQPPEASQQTLQPSQQPFTSDVTAVSASGEWLAKFLDGMDVEHRWLRGHDHVAWKTGLPLKQLRGKQLTPLRWGESHCSAFAAAVAENLQVYLLHPPEHSHVLLANAQYDWLASRAGEAAGWQPVKTALEAQAAANDGNLVVGVFKNSDPRKAGHIAVVRPSKKSPEEIAGVGPQVTQAGFKNFRSVDLATGFSLHPGAWQKGGGAVRFYKHALDAKKLAGE